MPEPEQPIHDLQRENAKLRRAVAELESYRSLAYRDALTGLWNRRYFEERLSQEQSLARRKASRRFSLMVLDLNDLKRINDIEGHAAGDQAIKRAGAFLRSRLRDTTSSAGWAATSSRSSCASWDRPNARCWSAGCAASFATSNQRRTGQRLAEHRHRQLPRPRHDRAATCTCAPTRRCTRTSAASSCRAAVAAAEDRRRVRDPPAARGPAVGAQGSRRPDAPLLGAGRRC